MELDISLNSLEAISASSTYLSRIIFHRIHTRLLRMYLELKITEQIFREFPSSPHFVADSTFELKKYSMDSRPQEEYSGLEHWMF